MGLMGDITNPIGAVVGGVSGLLGQESANSAAKQAAQTQMNFQERMSDTQWQRGVNDMKAAGLNPALAYSQGPNTAPGGASYTPGNVGASAMSGVNSAMSAMQQMQQIKQSGSQIANIDADTIKKAAETTNVKAATTGKGLQNITSKPAATEADIINNIYKNHPTIAKVKAWFDFITGSVDKATNSAKQLQNLQNQNFYEGMGEIP
nr:MAG: DNA pilot protein [Microviridae sp.]